MTNTTFKKSVSFVDGKRNKITVQIEIQDRNSYPELSISGDCGNSSGQIVDHIQPGNEAQTELINIWHAWHLNGMPNGTLYQYGTGWIRKDLPQYFENTLSELIERIEEAEEEKKGENLSDLSDTDLLALVEEITIYEGDKARLFAAVVRQFDLTQTDFDAEIFEALQPKCEGANDAILRLIERSCGLESFVQAAISADGRGHFLNSYDGTEDEIQFDGETFFFCRR